MKTRLFIVITLITFSVVSYAQKCKPFSSVVDEFSGEKTDFYGYFFNSNFYSQLLDSKGAMSYLLARKDEENKIHLSLQLRLPGGVRVDHPNWFNSEIKFLIKLDGEILSFTAKNPETALDKRKGGDAFTKEREGVNRFTLVSLESEISEENLQKIIDQDIEKIRFYVDGSTDDFFEDVIPGGKIYGKKVSEQFSCLL